MRNRRLWLVLVGLAELGVCAAMLAAIWGGFTWARDEGLRWRVIGSDRVSVESTEELRFAVAGPATLDLSNHVGPVTVTAGDTDAIVVTIRRTAWGADEAEAQARLAALLVESAQTGNAVTLAVPEPAGETVTIMGNQRADSVAFGVLVPAETAVSARTDFGAVSVAGTTGAAEAHTSAGPVTVQQVTGRVTASSDFGDVVVEDIAGDRVEASSSSGSLRLARVAATGAVDLDTDFGAVDFDGGAAGALSAYTSSGTVTLTGLEVRGPVVVDTAFGGVLLTDVAAGGGYDLHSSSGGIRVDGASGQITAKTDYGNVTVLNAQAATLDLFTSSGSVQFAGALGAGPHAVGSDFGSLTLSLPAYTALEVDLSTGFGRITSSLPLTLAGDLEADHWQGVLNGGGPRLAAATSSGDITLQPLP